MQTYKVLIVEDDPMVAMINEQYVRKTEGFEVAGSCRNGLEALEFLETTPVDLIVLDVFMPVMDGVETLIKLREKQIPVEVIMVTAANDVSTLEKTMHLGVTDYLIKPFAFERFQTALDKFTNKITFLKENSVLDQKSVDKLIFSGTNNSQRTNDVRFPKGIQPITLNNISQFFEENSGWHSSEIIAEKLGLSIVTVRHYLNYLERQGTIIENINYETGGRPCMLFKKRT